MTNKELYIKTAESFSRDKLIHWFVLLNENEDVYRAEIRELKSEIKRLRFKERCKQ
jgi:hypothetical protein